MRTLCARLGATLFLSSSITTLGLVACGGGTGNGASSTTSSTTSTSTGGETGDGGVDATADAYPAFSLDVPQIAKNQATVLESPVLVTISWPGADENASTWEAFDDAIGASTYWSATTAEYGVGPATSGAVNHIHMTTPLPATLSYTDLQNYVTATLQGPGDAGTDEAGDGGIDTPWPAPTVDAKGNVQTIYSLFIPSTTAVTDPGSGQPFCTEGALGYHDNVVVNGAAIPYSVTLECAPISLSDIEETAAHETIEAATNPYPESSTLGYVGFDPDHLAWDLYTGFADELADACQNWEASYVHGVGAFPYWVQLSWSNEAALAGHDPCVPAATGPYHGMTLFPSEEASITVDLSVIGGGKVPTRGFKVTVGKPLTFHVGFFSDGPASPWTISYDFPKTLPDFDQSFSPLGNGAGTVSLDKTTGQNGDMVTVTVTPTGKGEGGFHVMAITWDPPSSSAYLPRYLPVLLVDE